MFTYLPPQSGLPAAFVLYSARNTRGKSGSPKVSVWSAPDFCLRFKDWDYIPRRRRWKRVGGGEEMMYQEREVSVECWERRLRCGEIVTGGVTARANVLRQFTLFAVTSALWGEDGHRGYQREKKKDLFFDCQPHSWDRVCVFALRRDFLCGVCEHLASSRHIKDAGLHVLMALNTFEIV